MILWSIQIKLKQNNPQRVDAQEGFIVSFISNNQFTDPFEGQPPIKQALTAAIDTCESRPGHFIIMWSPKQGSLGSLSLSPCHCGNKVETGACPLGYSWWQVGPSHSEATHNAHSHSQSNRGTMGSLSEGRSGCLGEPVCWLSLHLKMTGGQDITKCARKLPACISCMLFMINTFIQTHSTVCARQILPLFPPPSLWLNTATQWWHPVN